MTGTPQKRDQERIAAQTVDIAVPPVMEENSPTDHREDHGSDSAGTSGGHTKRVEAVTAVFSERVQQRTVEQNADASQFRERPSRWRELVPRDRVQRRINERCLFHKIRTMRRMWRSESLTSEGICARRCSLHPADLLMFQRVCMFESALFCPALYAHRCRTRSTKKSHRNNLCERIAAPICLVAIASGLCLWTCLFRGQ